MAYNIYVGWVQHLPASVQQHTGFMQNLKGVAQRCIRCVQHLLPFV